MSVAIMSEHAKKLITLNMTCIHVDISSMLIHSYIGVFLMHEHEYLYVHVHLNKRFGTFYGD